MCGYCWDQDDYDDTHSHKCNDTCASRCDLCGNATCEGDLISVDDAELACQDCAK